MRTSKRERPRETAHFTVVCSVTWPLSGSKVKDDFVLIKPDWISNVFMPAGLYFHMKGSEVCVKTKSIQASLPLEGLVIKYTRTIKAFAIKSGSFIKRRRLLLTQAKTVAEIFQKHFSPTNNEAWVCYR